MDCIEILAGAEFANAVRELELTSAQCTYHYQPPEDSYREDYQVWLLSKEDFETICAIDNGDWKEDWGWWRHNGGYNGGSPDTEFTINGEKLLAWDSQERENYFKEECQHCSDFLNKRCLGAIEDQEECYGRRKYKDILSYIHNEMNLSTETNVCALCISLARYNHLTLSELLKKYLG